MGYYHVRGTGMAEMGSLDHVCSRHLLINANFDDVFSQIQLACVVVVHGRALAIYVWYGYLVVSLLACSLSLTLVRHRDSELA
jgi:hypothetical protein